MHELKSWLKLPCQKEAYGSHIYLKQLGLSSQEATKNCIKLGKCHWKNALGACNQLRPQNINLQDWKYTSFVVFVGYSHSIRRHNAMCTDELVADVAKNIGLKFQFSSWFSIHLLLHQL